MGYLIVNLSSTFDYLIGSTGWMHPSSQLYNAAISIMGNARFKEHQEINAYSKYFYD